MEKFNIIYADPPWAHSNAKTGGNMKSGASQKYNVMDVGSIASLDVRSIYEEDTWLFMWWLGSMPYEALRVIFA